MQEKISYSHLFSSMDEIILYLQSTNAPKKYIEDLKQTQQLLVIFELLNIVINNVN